HTRSKRDWSSDVCSSDLVWRAGRLHPLPEGFHLLAPTRLAPFLASGLFSWPGKLRMALDLVLPRGVADDESLSAFVRRRLGREEIGRASCRERGESGGGA